MRTCGSGPQGPRLLPQAATACGGAQLSANLSPLNEHRSSPTTKSAPRRRGTGGLASHGQGAGVGGAEAHFRPSEGAAPSVVKQTHPGRQARQWPRRLRRRCALQTGLAQALRPPALPNATGQVAGLRPGRRGLGRCFPCAPNTRRPIFPTREVLSPEQRKPPVWARPYSSQFSALTTSTLHPQKAADTSGLAGLRGARLAAFPQGFRWP